MVFKGDDPPEARGFSYPIFSNPDFTFSPGVESFLGDKWRDGAVNHHANGEGPAAMHATDGMADTGVVGCRRLPTAGTLDCDGHG